jgi:hypothetical protein
VSGVGCDTPAIVTVSCPLYVAAATFDEADML